MRKLYILSVFAFLVLFAPSCDKDFKEINTDPNNSTSVESGLLMADAIRNVQNQLYSTFVGGDMGSCWSQQWAKVQYNDEERYSPRTAVIQTFWDVLYESFGMEGYVIYNLAVEEENENMQAVGLVMQAFAFSVLTDVWGNVPCKESFLAGDGNTAPVYDTQQEVYTKVVELLTQADGLFSADGGTINAGADLLYQGDYAKWKMFANSLKFRTLMRVSGTSMHDKVAMQDAANKSFGSQSDEAKLMFLEANPNANPIYESVVYGSRKEYKVSDVLVNLLKLNVDPRLEVYAQPNDADEYRGKPAGIADVPSLDYNYENVSAIGELYLEPTLPGYFMSYAQLQLLKAEAAFKGYISGSAQTYFAQGIAASMAENGITTYTISTALTVGSELQQIAEQEWLALFSQGIESWVEWRRTGYPVLTPAVDAVISVIPQRFTYPTTEQSLNVTNYNAAVASQGPDALSTTLWSNK